jgi:nitrogen fixation NifU-like protein
LAEKIIEAQQLTELGYSNRAIELYQNKINIGTIDDATTGAVISGPNGDLIRLYLKFNNENIEDAKFLCYGCPAASAAMSALTLLLRGKPLGSAKKLIEDDVLEALRGLPEPRQDCAELAIKVLKKALLLYEQLQEQ